jgi:hypothetical protein
MKAKVLIMVASLLTTSVNLVSSQPEQLREPAYCEGGQWRGYLLSPGGWCPMEDVESGEILCNYVAANYCENNPELFEARACEETPVGDKAWCCWGIWSCEE